MRIQKAAAVLTTAAAVIAGVLLGTAGAASADSVHVHVVEEVSSVSGQTFIDCDTVACPDLANLYGLPGTVYMMMDSTGTDNYLGTASTFLAASNFDISNIGSIQKVFFLGDDTAPGFPKNPWENYPPVYSDLAGVTFGNSSAYQAALALAGLYPDQGGNLMPASIPASTATGQGTVIVDGSIQIVVSNVDKSFTLEGLADAANVATPDNGISYTVTTDNMAGYSVALQAASTNLVPGNTTTNTDVIPFSDITATGTPSTDPSLPNGGTSTGGTGKLGTTALPVYNQTSRSKEAGDVHRATFTANIPFVNADTYQGTVNFIATAN